MRCAHLVPIGAAFMLAGCANSPYPFATAAPVAQIAAAPAHPVAQSAADCTANGSMPFGQSANMSSLSTLIEATASQTSASQGCAWEKATHVDYGSIATGSIGERK